MRAAEGKAWQKGAAAASSASALLPVDRRGAETNKAARRQAKASSGTARPGPALPRPFPILPRARARVARTSRAVRYHLAGSRAGRVAVTDHGKSIPVGQWQLAGSLGLQGFAGRGRDGDGLGGRTTEGGMFGVCGALALGPGAGVSCARLLLFNRRLAFLVQWLLMVF